MRSRSPSDRLYSNVETQDEEITEIDELQTFVGYRKNKFWIWTVVNHLLHTRALSQTAPSE